MIRNIHLSFKEELSDYLFITIGLLGYTIGFTCFQLPYQITELIDTEGLVQDRPTQTAY